MKKIIKELIKSSPIYNLYKEVRAKSDKQSDSNYIFTNYAWDISLDERKKLLKADTKKIGFLYPGRDAGTFRFRAHNIVEVINQTDDLSATFFFGHELIELREFLSNLDALVIVRCPWNLTLGEIIKDAKAQGIELIYDVDDYVFDPAMIPTITEQVVQEADVNNIDSPLQGFYVYHVAGIFTAMNQIDKYTTTVPALQKKLEKFWADKTEAKVDIIPNFLRADEVEHAQKLVERGKPEQPFTIVYGSGSKTHDKDFLIAAPAIFKFMAAHPDTQLKIVGNLNVGSEFDLYGDRVTQIGLLNYINLLDEYFAADINIAPLVLNQFTECKSEIRYFNAGIVATPTIATPTKIYESFIVDRKNGFLAETDEEWLQKLEFAYSNQDKLKQIGEAARNYSLENYSGVKIASVVNNYYSKIFK